MAEGGDENEQNPFSFKKFVRKSSRDSPNSMNDSTEEDQQISVDLLDGSCSTERREEERHARDAERDTNPFSFKKFLQTAKSTPSSGPTSLKTLDLANDLPDFVQNHYSGSDSQQTRHRSETQRSRPHTDVPLPDFAIDSAIGNLPLPDSEPDDAPAFVPNSSNGAFSLENSVLNLALNFVQPEVRVGTNAQSAAVVPDLNLDIGNPVDSDSDDGQGICQANTAGGLPDFLSESAGGLPDFLPDSAISGAGARPKVTWNVHHVVENGVSADVDVDLEETSPRILQLQAENAELRRQLQEAREETERTQQRLNAMILANDSHQVKEVEETAVLERIVQQVEANLQTTTQRALKAEATIAKLRQEITQLNDQVEHVQQENVNLQQDHNIRDPLRDKTRRAANQISEAAKSAEQHLKQLLTGVDTLKMVSNVLLSTDKLTDVLTEPSADVHEPQGAEGGT